MQWQLEINMAMKDSSNGWKENIFTHKVPKGCSSFKLLMGNEWTTFLNGFGLPTNTSCPVPVVRITLKNNITSYHFEINFSLRTFIDVDLSLELRYCKSTKIYKFRQIHFQLIAIILLLICKFCFNHDVNSILKQ